MDYNVLLFILLIILDLCFVLFAWKLGKNWVVGTIIANIIMANIFVAKLVPMFGFITTAGEVFYASIFIATDIISEHHGKKEAYKSIWTSFLVLIIFTLFGRLILEFSTIEESSAAAAAMETLFTSIPRIIFASFVAYVIAQRFDIWIFHKIKEKTSGKKLWLRNNISTISSQFLDALIFSPIAFYGTVPNEILVSLILTAWLFKIPVALLDTPFMYLSYIIKGKTPPDFKKLKTSKTESPAAGMQ